MRACTTRRSRKRAWNKSSASLARSVSVAGTNTESGDYYSLAANSVPCRSIGGDFFDYETSDSGVSLLLGDVAGKGPPAALLSAIVIGIFKGLITTGSDVATSVGHANSAIYRTGIQSRFVTLFFATLKSNGVLDYCNAGHNPPLLIGKSSVGRLEMGGPIVGLFGPAAYEQARMKLAPKDLLVVFTDGVSDALNADGEESGEERIIQAVRGAASGHPRSIVETLMKSVHTFAAGAAQNDDTTAMVVKYTG